MRLYLRTWQEVDLHSAYELWGDPKVTEFIDARRGFTKEQAGEKLREFIQMQKKYGVQYWAVILKETNEIIGCCGLRPYDIGQNIYELGFHFMSRVWGKGYAGEAAKAVIDYAFAKLHIRKLFAAHNPLNAASKKLLLKLGFHHVRDELYEPTGLMHPSYELANPGK